MVSGGREEIKVLRKMRAELLYNLKVGVNLMLKDTAWLTERKRLSAKVVLGKGSKGNV